MNMKYYKSIIPILGREKFDEKETQKTTQLYENECHRTFYSF